MIQTKLGIFPSEQKAGYVKTHVARNTSALASFLQFFSGPRQIVLFNF